MARAERINEILRRTGAVYKKRGEVVVEVKRAAHNDWTDGLALRIGKSAQAFGGTMFYVELFELPTCCGQLVLAYEQHEDSKFAARVLGTLVYEAARERYGSIMYSSTGVHDSLLKKLGFEEIHKFRSPRTANIIRLYNLDITTLVPDPEDDGEDWQDDGEGDY